MFVFESLLSRLKYNDLYKHCKATQTMKSPNTTRLSFLLMLCISLFLIVSCSQDKSDYPIQVSMIPADAIFVMDIDVESLSSKLPQDEEGALPLMGLLDGKIDSSMINMLNVDEMNGSLDFDAMIVFAQSKKEIGVTMQMLDSAYFESAIQRINDSTDMMLKVHYDEGVKSCMLEDSGLLLLWDGQKALFMSGTSLAEGLDIFNQDISQSLMTNADFADFYANKKEVSVWFDMEGYASVIGDLPQLKGAMGFPMMTEYEDMYKGMYTSYHVEFLDGKIVAVGKSTPYKKAKALADKFYQDQPSEELLSAVPANTYLLASGALNMPELLEMYKSLPQYEELMNNPDAKKIIESIEGDVVLSISDFASGPLPIPNAVIGLSVSDRTIMESLLEMDGVQKVDKEGYTALLVQMFQIFVAQKDDLLLITTDEDIISAFVLGKALEDNISDSKHELAITSGGYFYMNLDLATYPAAITGLLQGKVGNKFSSISQASVLEDISAWYDSETCENTTVMNLKDKEVNSLTAIVEMMEALLDMK